MGHIISYPKFRYNRDVLFCSRPTTIWRDGAPGLDGRFSSFLLLKSTTMTYAYAYPEVENLIY